MVTAVSMTSMDRTDQKQPKRRILLDLGHPPDEKTRVDIEHEATQKRCDVCEYSLHYWEILFHFSMSLYSTSVLQRSCYELFLLTEPSV